MTHADDDGLVLPPRLAPVHVVIMPITFKADDPAKIMNYCHKIADDLRVQAFHGRHIEVEIDDRDMRGGEKNWSWVKKGVPIRIEVGTTRYGRGRGVHGSTRPTRQGEAGCFTNGIRIKHHLDARGHPADVADTGHGVPR